MAVGRQVRGRNWPAMMHRGGYRKAVVNRMAGLLGILIVCLALVGAFGLAMTGRAEAAGADNLLKNSIMQASADGDGPLAAWKSYVWSGQGSVARHVLPDGRSAALLRNDGPAKQGMFQDLQLQPCSYRLTVDVAASELVDNEDKLAGALHISFGAGRSALTFNLVQAGTTPWQRTSATFSVPVATSAIVYFFNYGSGAFFVRDARLAPMSPCATVADSAGPPSPMGETLAYEAPIGPEGRLLAGYCGQATFRTRPVCRQIARSAPTEAPAPPKPQAARLVADFENGSIFTGQVPAVAGAIISGAASAHLQSQKFMATSREQGLAPDWQGYDWLRVDVLNPSTAAQPLYIEINDGQSAGYWTRVNWTTSVVPGRSSVSVPLHVHVGEKSVIGNRRRLDLADIKRLVLTATGADLIVDNIRLEIEPPFATDFPELIKLDVGPMTSPVFPGFTALHPAVVYREQVGFGFAKGTRLARAEDRRHPGSLLGDWVSVHSGGIDVDLPNGKYRIWMMLEDPGYWDYYPSFTRRSITAQGQSLLEEVRSVDLCRRQPRRRK